MNIRLRIVLSIAMVIYYLCIVYLLKKKSLNIKYTLLWLFSGFIMVLVVIFPWTFLDILKTMGIVDPTNGLFALVEFGLLIILVSITSIVSKLNERLRSLIQQCSIYEKRIRRLERQLSGNIERKKEEDEEKSITADDDI